MATGRGMDSYGSVEGEVAGFVHTIMSFGFYGLGEFSLHLFFPSSVLFSYLVLNDYKSHKYVRTHREEKPVLSLT
jgi:hypothetical protein